MIELENFSAGYGGEVKIRVETMVIRPGRVMGILGRNGSGKSTLLRALTGILPYGGTARLDGTDLSSLSSAERAKRLAFLPQQLSPVRMEIGTLAAHGRFARLPFSKVLGEADREAVRKALVRTGLWEVRHRKVDELSGGEKQRAYLAMVLAQDAPYLLLDEPASSLDIACQIEIMDLLRDLAREGKGILITSHDLPQTAACCDSVCLIDRGLADPVVPASDLAGNRDRLRQVMGVSLVPAEKGIYPYVLDG